MSGKIYDAKTREALPFVNIAFKGSKIGTTTDIDGEYRIETYYAEDSLVASFIGYKPLAKAVKKDQSQTIDFFLDPGSVSLGEVVVNAQDFENPADIILKKIIKNKPINNREKLDSYQYETYNKIEFDLNNLSKKFTERKIFKDFDFIFNQMDSSNAKVALPFFMTERSQITTTSDNPKDEKKLSKPRKFREFNNESITQFLGQMYLDVNIYENSLGIFGKNFISPISNYGIVFTILFG